MNKREEAEDLIASGYTYRETGQKLGISHTRVHALIMPSKSKRLEVYKRAKSSCEQCRVHLPTRGHVHHLRNRELDFNGLTNLLLLCPSCHSLAHNNRICLKCLQQVGAQEEICQNCGSTDLQLTGRRGILTTLRIDDDLLERIDAFASEFSYNRSRAIRVLVEVALSHERTD